jgi:hypothetical protein
MPHIEKHLKTSLDARRTDFKAVQKRYPGCHREIQGLMNQA